MAVAYCAAIESIATLVPSERFIHVRPLRAFAEFRRYGAFLALVALLVAEVVALTVAFDTRSLDEGHTIWARLLGWTPQYLRLAITIAVVTLLFTGRDLWTAIRHGASPIPRHIRPALLLPHAAALALFAITQNRIVNHHFAGFQHQGLWALAWLVTAVATAGTWALAVAPASSLLKAARGTWRGLAVGTAVGLTVWGAGFVTSELWKPLASGTFAVVSWMLHFIYPDTVSDPAKLILGTPRFKVHVAPVCSGYEGIGLILAFLGVYLWIERRNLRFPAALLLLPIGAVAIWILNAFRLVLLIAIGTAGWKDVAMGGFHSQAGWIAFNGLALGIVALTMHRGYFRKETVAPPELAPAGLESDATPAYLAPFAAITATAMLTGAFSAGFDWLYPLRVVAAVAVLWCFRRTYMSLTWTLSWQPIAIGAATSVAWIALTPADSAPQVGWPQALASVPAQWAALWVAIRLVGYVVTVPIAEELAFRGFLPRRMRGADFDRLPVAFTWPTFLISSALFGAFHGKFWLGGVIAGMAFALALYRRGRIVDAVQAHATTNGLLALYAFTTGQWSVLG